MQTAQAVAIFTAIFLAILLPLLFAGKLGQAEQEKAKARRMAEHRMSARLLRFNL